MRRLSPRLGSARGFSQPLSGLLADPSFAALFRAAAVPGLPPPEVSPHRNRAPLSRPLLLPCGHRPTLVTRPPGLIAAGFSRRPRSHAVALVSPTTMGSLFTTAETVLTRSPWTPTNGIVTSRQLHPLRSLDPPASPFTHDPSCPEPPGRSSLGLSPLKPSPPTPGSLEPAYALRRKQRPTPESAGLRREGLAPLDRVGPPPGRSLTPIPSAA
jgi:hypothetical protein